MAKRKRLNRRVLIVLGIFAGVVALGVVALLIRSLPKDPAPFINKAEQAMKQDPPDYEDAVRNYNIAIGNEQPTPEVEHLYRLAEIHLERAARDPKSTPEQRRRDYGLGLKYLEDCLIQDPTYLKARRMLADFRMLQARSSQRWDAWQEYIDQMDEIIALEPSAKEYFQRGVAKTALARSDPRFQDEALKDLRKAIELDPKNVQYWTQLARYLQGIDRKDQAERVFQQALEALPGDADIRVRYAQYLLGEDRSEEGLAMIQQAVRVEPDKPAGLVALGNYYLAQQELDKARQAVDRARKIDPRDVAVYDLLAKIARRQKKMPEAIEALREGLKVLGDWEVESSAQRDRKSRAQAYLNYLLGQALFDQYVTTAQDQRDPKLIEQARQAYDVVRKLSPDSAGRYTLAGLLDVTDRNWQSARDNLEQAVAKGASLRAALQLVDVYKRLGMSGRAEKVIDRIRNMPEQVNNTYFMLEKAKYRMDARDYDMARRLIRRVLETEPENAEAIRLRKALAIATGENTDLKAGQSEEDKQMARQWMARRADELAMTGEYDQARALLETLYRDNPEDITVLSRLLTVTQRAGRREEALELARQALKDDPENPDLKRWVALMEEPDPEKRFQIDLAQAETIEDPLRRALRRFELCAAYGKMEEADQYLEQARKIDPANPQVLEIRFLRALARKQWAQAETILAEVPEDRQDVRRQYRVRMLVARQDFDQAIPLLEELLKERSYDTALRRMLAGCYLETGRDDLAKAQYETLLANNARNVQAMVGLAKIAQKQGQADEHERWVRQAYYHPEGQADPYIREWHLRLVTESDDLRKAIAEREKILRSTPDDMDNMIRLAGLYEQDRQYDKAEALLKQVYDRAQNKLLLVPMLAEFYARRDRSSEADSLFMNLLETTQQPETRARVYMAYANFLLQTDPAAAEGMYNKAIQADPKLPAAQNALGDFYARQAQQAQRQGQLDQARQLWEKSVQQARKASELQPDQARLRVILYRRMIDAGRLKDAIAGFESLLQDDPDSVDARVGLGLAYLRENRLDEAREQFDEALKRDPRSVDALAHRSEVFRSRGMFTEAVDDIREALRQSSNIMLMMDLGGLYRAMGDMESAQRAFDRVIAKYPNYFPAYQNLAELFAIQQKWVPLDRLAKVGMEQFPENPYFPMMLARRWEAAGRTNDQLRWLDHALQLAPENVGLVREYMTAMIQADLFEQARALAGRYVNQPAHRAGVLALQARANAEAGPGKATIQPFLEAMKAAENPADLLFVINTAQRALGSETTLAEAQQIVQARPEAWQSYFAVGNLYQQAQQYARARQMYEKALELAGTVASRIGIRGNLAHAFEGLKQYPKAAEQYETILQQDRFHVASLNNLAYLYTDKLDEPKKALPLIERAMRLRPGDANLLDTFAWTLAKMGRYLQAKETLEDLPQFKSPAGSVAFSVDAAYHMGYVLEKTGDYRQARTYYKQARDWLRQHPDHALVQPVEEAYRRVERALNKE